MRELSRITKAFEFSVSVANSMLCVNQKEVGRIEQEVLDFIALKQAEIEKLNKGCKIIIVDKSKTSA